METCLDSVAVNGSEVSTQTLSGSPTLEDATHSNDHTAPNKRRKLDDDESIIAPSTASALSALRGAVGGFTKTWFSNGLQEQGPSLNAQTRTTSTSCTNQIINGTAEGSQLEDASTLRSSKLERLWGSASQTLSSGTVVGDSSSFVLPPGLEFRHGEGGGDDGEFGEGGVIKLIKRGRGRPRKYGGLTKGSREVLLDTATNTILKNDDEDSEVTVPKKGKRGRRSNTKSRESQSKKSIEPFETPEAFDPPEPAESVESIELVDASESLESVMNMGHHKGQEPTHVPNLEFSKKLMKSSTGYGSTAVAQNLNITEKGRSSPAETVTPTRRKVGRPRKQPTIKQWQEVEGSRENEDTSPVVTGEADELDSSEPRRSCRARKPSRYVGSEPTSPAGSPRPLPTSVRNHLDQQNSRHPRKEIPDSQISGGSFFSTVKEITPSPSLEKRGDPSKQGSVLEAIGPKSIPVGNVSSATLFSESRQSPWAMDETHSRNVSFGDLNAVPKKKRGRPRLLPEPVLHSTEEPQSPFHLCDEPQSKVVSQPLEELSALYKTVFEDLNTADHLGFEKRLDTLKQIILEQLTGRRRIHLKGLEQEYNKVAQLIEHTVDSGESNSMIITGARGSGKTTLIENALSALSLQYHSDFYVIRLNGFIQTDDKLALREIWRQLGRELETEDDIAGKPGNYADTLTSLLALLSHPSELSNNASDHDVRSVVFILEEVDLFASHPRQTLLYNLFDIAQARKAPVAVIGISSRIDVVDSLEKRVKSRFSHRQVHISLPANSQLYWEICKEALTIRGSNLQEFSKGQISREIQILGSEEGRDFLFKWSYMVSVGGLESPEIESCVDTPQDLYEMSQAFRNHIERQFSTSRSVAGFFSSAIPPIQGISLFRLPLNGSSFTGSSFEAPDSKLDMLPALSDLSLALLIAAARLELSLETPCNFNMAYAEYSELASRMKARSSASGALAIGHTAKVWGKEAAAKAWESLAKLELILPAASAGGGAGGVTARARMYRVDVALEEIEGSVGINGLSGGMSKWCREL